MSEQASANWFGRWIKRHADIFGIRDANEVRSMASWIELFDARNFNESELHAATDSLSTKPEIIGGLIYLGKMAAHLYAIQAVIKDLRTIAYRKDVADHQDRGSCTLCSGTGRLVVPHLKSTHEGEWRPLKIARAGALLYTCSVRCSCALGNWMRDKVTKKGRDGDREEMMGLEQYERQNPRWRQQMDAKAEEERRLAEIARRNGPVVSNKEDRMFDETLKSLLANYATV